MSNKNIFGEIKESSDQEEQEVFTETAASLGLGCLISLVRIPLFIFGNAFILMTLWNWFMVLISFPAISFLTALGLLILLDFLRSRSDKKLNLDKDIQGEVKTKGVLYVSLKALFLDTYASLFGLVFGYVVHFFM